MSFYRDICWEIEFYVGCEISFSEFLSGYFLETSVTSCVLFFFHLPKRKTFCVCFFTYQKKKKFCVCVCVFFLCMMDVITYLC